jgi:hypothetical protein
MQKKMHFLKRPTKDYLLIEPIPLKRMARADRFPVKGGLMRLAGV